MSKRNISLSVFFKILFGNITNSILFGFGVVSMAFSFLFIVITSLVVVTTNSKNNKDYDDYDVSLILEKGIEVDADVVAIDTIKNIKINERNPLVVVYNYEKDGERVTDRFKTIDHIKTQELFEAGNVPVKYYNGESVIIGLDRYNGIGHIFLLINFGLILWSFLLLYLGGRKAFKTYNLYKTGIVKEAEIDTIALFPNKGIRVTYHYDLTDGYVAYGNGFSKDYLLMNKESGDKVKIFVDRKKESNSVLVPPYIIIY